jgi:RNA polymerase sigma-70 factor (ECF subfamily)
MVGTSRQAAQERSALSDNELIARSLRGDVAAYGELVARYRALVAGVAYRVSGDPVLAEDIAQETFIRVWDRLSTYRPEGNLKGWLCRIASNLTVDALRRRKPTADIADISVAASGTEPELAILEDEQAEAVRRALMRLPLRSRTVLVLREYEGLSYQEIADVLDIPLGTVKSRLNDARRRLRDELAGYLGEQVEA